MINLVRVNLCRISQLTKFRHHSGLKQSLRLFSLYVINRSILTFDPNRTRRRIGIHITLQRDGNAFPQRESEPRNATNGEWGAICKMESKTECHIRTARVTTCPVVDSVPSSPCRVREHLNTARKARNGQRSALQTLECHCQYTHLFYRKWTFRYTYKSIYWHLSFSEQF